MVALLVLQPDFGQTMLVVLVWGALFFLAGMRLVWVFGLGGVAGVGLTVAYCTVPHVARRIQRFLDPASGDTFNVDRRLESFMRGGWFGRGPGEGTVKRHAAGSHTDFVFAVAAEEFGIALCLVAGRAVRFRRPARAASRAQRNDDPFTRFAVAGLAMLFGAAVGDQHGGEPASDPGQGHDAAVHLLWRFLDDLARLRHGHAAGADARASALGTAAATARVRRGREPGLMQAGGAVPPERLPLGLNRKALCVFLSGRIF